jgi:PTS system cellobiose-specific IIC component
MQKFINEKFMPIATKIQNNKWVKLIMGATAGAMPATMIGAIFSMINALPLGSWYTDFLTNSGLGAVITDVANISNLIAVFAVVGIGYNIAKMYDHDPFQGAIVALVSFLIVTPTTTMSGDTVVTGVLPQSYLGAKGLFCAYIIGILSYQIFRFFLERNIVIKLPDSVPPMIGNSFVAIVPAFGAGFVMFLIRWLFGLTPYGNIHDFIYRILQVPLTNIGDSIPAYYIALLILLILWLCGIHGTLLVLQVVGVLWNTNYLENLEAYNSGLPLPHEMTSIVMRFVMQYIGGPGNLLGLAVCCLLFAKSARYKALAKVTVVPDIFNIIEPTIYGYPLVANPTFAIPFILAPIVCLTLSILLIQGGVLALPVINPPVFATPGFIAAFLIGGGWQWGVWWWVMLAISVVLYLPFFKAADNQALKEEKDAETKKASQQTEAAVQG